MEQAKELALIIIKAIVDAPDAVFIEAKQDEMGVLFLVKVAPEDMGKVIGRQGKTAEAIRELLRVIGYRARAKISLRFEEPEGGRFQRSESRESYKEQF